MIDFLRHFDEIRQKDGSLFVVMSKKSCLKGGGERASIVIPLFYVSHIFIIGNSFLKINTIYLYKMIRPLSFLFLIPVEYSIDFNTASKL